MNKKVGLAVLGLCLVGIGTAVAMLPPVDWCDRHKTIYAEEKGRSPYDNQLPSDQMFVAEYEAKCLSPSP